MAIHTLQRVQRLPVPLEEAWAFFSSPQNLKKITPPEMGFDILSDPVWTESMYPGQIITYTIRPLWNIPMFWMTEITHVDQGKYFIDEQRIGPYAIWHHQHHFREIPGGVEMTDLLHYQLPLGIIGRWAHRLFVKKRVAEIFNFRYAILKNKFGELPSA